MLGGRSLAALSTLLGDRPYVMGDRMSATDATAFALVAGVLTPFFDSPLRRSAQRHSNLVAYTDRMMRRFYPAHPWTSAERRPARTGLSLRKGRIIAGTNSKS